MKYTFKVEVEPEEGIGLDDAERVGDEIEEAMRNHGFDNGTSFKVFLVKTEAD